MNNNNFNTEQVMSFLRNQWKPVGLIVITFLILIVTLLIPSGGKNNTRNNPGRQGISNQSTKNSPDSSNKSSSPLSFLFGTKKESSNTKQQIIPTGVKTPPNVITSNTSQSTVTRIQPDGTATTQKVTGTSVVNTTQGTINPNTNIATDLTSNTQQDILSMVFQNPDGTTFTYIPPGTPPDEVRWARYTNNIAKYAINYPYNWQFVYSVENGNEGIALYPPGSNPNDPNSQYIGFGIANNFLLPTTNEGSVSAHITPIIADGVPGNLYTNGAIGNSYIASVFSYSGKYFGLAGSKSDTTFAYVYYYMLQSLTFNIE